MVGQQKVSIRIEIGNRTLPENVMEKHVSNGNFVLTHQKHPIILPEDDEYKPHMAIRCECFGSFFMYPTIHKQFDSETIQKVFSQKILIGTCTIKSIGDFCISNQELTSFSKNNSNRNYIHAIDVLENSKIDNLIAKTVRNRCYN